MAYIKKILALLTALLLLLPAAALGESYDCFMLDMDALDLSRARDESYIASYLTGEAQGLRVMKTIQSQDGAAQRVRLIVMRQDGSLLLDKGYEAMTGRFDSGDIYFTANDKGIMSYEVTLLVGATVYQLPFRRSLGRLRDNTACTYGLRFIDGNGSLTDTYMMGTMMSLSALAQAGGRTQISLCASNRYLIGMCDVALENGILTVTPMLYREAKADIKHCYVYIIESVGQLTSITPSEIGLPAYPAGTPIDVSGLDLIMLYVPMLLDYDPASLQTFAYDLWGDGQLQTQLSMWDANRNR